MLPHHIHFTLLLVNICPLKRTENRLLWLLLLLLRNCQILSASKPLLEQGTQSHHSGHNEAVKQVSHPVSMPGLHHQGLAYGSYCSLGLYMSFWAQLQGCNLNYLIINVFVHFCSDSKISRTCTGRLCLTEQTALDTGMSVKHLLCSTDLNPAQKNILY